MASKTSSIAALFLALNLLLFSSVSGQYFASNPSQILTCPPDTVKLDVCLSVLNGLLGVVVGDPGPCCTLLSGLVDLDANVCLCTALKLNVLGIVNLNVPLSLDALLNTCHIPKPTGFICA